jgi:hypothetical protein
VLSYRVSSQVGEKQSSRDNGQRDRKSDCDGVCHDPIE